MAVLLTGVTDDGVAPGCAVPGLGSGVSGAGANIAACGDAAMKTGAPVESDDKMTGRAVGCDAAITPGIAVPPAPAAAAAAYITIYVTPSVNLQLLITDAVLLHSDITEDDIRL